MTDSALSLSFRNLLTYNHTMTLCHTLKAAVGRLQLETSWKISKYLVQPEQSRLINQHMMQDMHCKQASCTVLYMTADGGASKYMSDVVVAATATLGTSLRKEFSLNYGWRKI